MLESSVLLLWVCDVHWEAASGCHRSRYQRRREGRCISDSRRGLAVSAVV